MPFPRTLAWREMLTIPSRIWTWVTDSNFSNDDYANYSQFYYLLISKMRINGFMPFPRPNMPYYFPKAEVGTNGFMPFPRVIAWWKMLTVLSRIWALFPMSITIILSIICPTIYPKLTWEQMDSCLFQGY